MSAHNRTPRPARGALRRRSVGGACSFTGTGVGVDRQRFAISRDLAEALDPLRVPGPVRRLADLAPEEQARLRALYERPAGPPAGRRSS